MLVLRVKEEVVVHIKYQYVNILHGKGWRGDRYYWTNSSFSFLARIFKAQLVPGKFMKQTAGVAPTHCH